MDNQCLTIAILQEYRQHLWEEERSKMTIEKYMRDIRRFSLFLGEDRVLSKERVIAFKAYLGEHYKANSANSMLAAVNGLLSWLGLAAFRVRSFKYQRQIFCDASREITKREYEHMVAAARRNGNKRLEMIMQTICGTGIRIGELHSITVEAVRQGKATVTGKGKNRVVFLPAKLRRYLLDYCRKKGLRQGTVFVTKTGKPVNRTNVWREMKILSRSACVEMGKVFPHNLRHLFARTCYSKMKDIVYLADILGHSSIETTRIYTVSSGNEHQQILQSLRLII